MRTLKLGKFRNTLTEKGQPYFLYENYYVFPLEKGVFHKAGDFHWPGEHIDPEGISINTDIRRETPTGSLIVHDKDRERYFYLENEEMAENIGAVTERNGVELFVIPLEAFEQVNIK